ncbi:MAG: HAD family hydrolase [Shewanella sp.]
MKKIYVFDLCHTLYDSNTTFEFISYVRGGVIFRVLKNKIVKKIVVLLGKLINKDIYRLFFIYQLNGMTKDELLERASSFVEVVLDNKKNTQIHEILEREKKLGSTCVIVSASLDVIVEAVSAHLGIDMFYASELMYEDNKSTGRLKYDLLGEKSNLSFIKENNDDLECVVTDNISDLLLVKMARTSVILSRLKNVQFWLDNNIPVDFIIK